MQTFLPEKSYDRCAEVLDDKRLVKQLLECRQIMTALAGESRGWVNHPATKMWRGYEYELLKYAESIKNELMARNFKWENNWRQIQDTFRRKFNGIGAYKPYWQTNTDYHKKIMRTHRANLFLKNSEHYPEYSHYAEEYRKDVCCDRCNYFWVTHLEDK